MKAICKDVGDLYESHLVICKNLILVFSSQVPAFGGAINPFDLSNPTCNCNPEFVKLWEAGQWVTSCSPRALEEEEEEEARRLEEEQPRRLEEGNQRIETILGPGKDAVENVKMQDDFSSRMLSSSINWCPEFTQAEMRETVFESTVAMAIDISGMDAGTKTALGNTIAYAMHETACKPVSEGTTDVGELFFRFFWGSGVSSSFIRFEFYKSKSEIRNQNVPWARAYISPLVSTTT